MSQHSNNMQNKKKPIPLDYPIEVDGITVKELNPRRPQVVDMLAVGQSSESDAEKELTLFANLCGVSPQSLHTLDMKDYGKLQTRYQSFLS